MAIDPMTAAAVIKVGGSILGKLFGGKKKSPAEIAADKYYQELVAIGTPPKEALAATYQRLQSQGELTPETEEIFMQADTELNKIEADPALKEAQMTALNSLRREAEQQGLTMEDKLALTQGQLSAEAEAKGRQGAILQDLAARGQLGAGQELAARMMAEQSGQQSEAMRSAQVAADARKRAIDAVLRGGEMAGNLRSQDFSEQERKAAAQDAINKFNVANRQQVTGANVDRRTEANKLNLGEKQRIDDTNVGLANKEADNRVAATEADYRNRLNLASAKYGAKTSQAQAESERKKQSAEGFAGVASGVGDIVGSALSKDYAKNLFNKKDPTKKE